MTTLDARISILVPTRGRPDSVERLVNSAATTARGNVEFIFYVDDDDPATRTRIIELAIRLGHTNVSLDTVVGPRQLLSQCWNDCAVQATADVVMHCGDDIVFRTPAWDDAVLDVFNRYDDHIVLVHGRDGFQDAGLATHGFVHIDWIDALGYLAPPYFASDYNDTWLTEVADAIGRRVYLPDVYTEHMHPVAGKGEWDQTHQERIERHRAEDCDAIWRRTAPQRLADTFRLREVIHRYAEDRRRYDA